MTKQRHLRPEFTQKLAEQLFNGAHINLISPHGQGRRRTLQDLRHALPDALSIFQTDLRTHEGDLKTWVSQAITTTKQTLLILHNFHLLSDIIVLKQLNTIKKQHNIALLSVSEKTAPNLLIHAENVLLPPITKTQLLIEFKRRQLPIDGAQYNQLADSLADWLLDQTSPYSLLDEVDKTWFVQQAWKN